MEPKARASQANKVFGSAGSQELMIKKAEKTLTIEPQEMRLIIIKTKNNNNNKEMRI